MWQAFIFFSFSIFFGGEGVLLELDFLDFVVSVQLITLAETLRLAIRTEVALLYVLPIQNTDF